MVLDGTVHKGDQLLSVTFLPPQISLDQLSLDLQKTHQNRLQTDERLQHMIKQRRDLPVFNKRDEILSAIYDSPITIIRGNTGCGKTTQVRARTSAKLSVFVREVEGGMSFFLFWEVVT